MLKMLPIALITKNINLCCEPALAQWSTLTFLAVSHQGRLTPKSVSPAGRAFVSPDILLLESITREAFKFYMHHHIYAN